MTEKQRFIQEILVTSWYKSGIALVKKARFEHAFEESKISKHFIFDVRKMELHSLTLGIDMAPVRKETDNFWSCWMCNRVADKSGLDMDLLQCRDRVGCRHRVAMSLQKPHIDPYKRHSDQSYED